MCCKTTALVVTLSAVALLCGWAFLGNEQQAVPETAVAAEPASCCAAKSTGPAYTPGTPEEWTEIATPYTPAPASEGTIIGTVSFSGAATRASLSEQMKANSNPFCASQHAGADVLDETLIVNEGKLQNVVVFIKSKKGDAIHGVDFPLEAKEAELVQEGCTYKPHVLALRAGQTLKVTNHDDTSHNVRLQTLNVNDDKVQDTKGKSDSWEFKTPETGGKITCSIHGWMSAVVHVFKHPFYAITGADGTFKISGVPAGTYTVVAWHETLDKIEKKDITIEAGKDATVDFGYEKK